MRGRRLLRGAPRRCILALAVGSALLALAAGCASTTAPRKWLPEATQAGAEPRGGWVLVEREGDPPRQRFEGELIAIEADSLFVAWRDQVLALPKFGIHRATVTGYDLQWGPLATWTVFGALATTSHGWGLVVTAPLWVLVGTMSTASASHAPMVRYPNRPWTELATYARFPQGLPAGLDRGAPGLR